jgi:hypothetical protein
VSFSLSLYHIKQVFVRHPGEYHFPFARFEEDVGVLILEHPEFAGDRLPVLDIGIDRIEIAVVVVGLPREPLVDVLV